MCRRSLAAAAVALGLAWLSVPGVPLYDGIGVPDEPYRYVRPSPGSRTTKPPTSANWRVPASKGASSDFIDAISGEQGPQVEIYASVGGLKGISPVKTFSLRADPIATEPAPGYTIDGNIYRLHIASTPPGPVAIAPGTDHVTDWIALRATSAKPRHPTFLYRPAPTTPWKPERTKKTGNDIFAADLEGPGDYALAYDRRSARHPRQVGGIPLTMIILAGALGLIVIAIGGIRIARSRSGTRGRSPAD
jgi:hypothetical protein